MENDKMKDIRIKRVLVIRFRQIGDAVLSTVICNTLRKNYPKAIIDLVLNQHIAPLFYNHPSIDNIFTFSEKEKHSAFTYLHKVYNIVHQNHYDVIIDMRSTMNTLPFSLFSPFTMFRIGIRKPYTRLVFNHTVNCKTLQGNKVEHLLQLLKPLEAIKPLQYVHRFTLYVTDDERKKFKAYMKEHGIDFNKPIALIGVTAKLSNKRWDEDKMAYTLKLLIENNHDLQLIFNYAPGQEKINAKRIFKKLNCNKHIFFDIQAYSLRELAAMAQLITVYFGNEGGTRHIVHAMGKPSFVVCSPFADKHLWLPQNETPALGVGVSDFLTAEQREIMSPQQQYEAITVDKVWDGLQKLIKQTVSDYLSVPTD